MTFDEAKTAAKSRLGGYLERLGVDLARAMSGSNTKCPICGHSAFHYYPDNRGGESWTCFSGCGSGDIFDLYAAKNGTSVKDAFSAVFEMLGLRAGDGKGKHAPSPSGPVGAMPRRAKASPSVTSAPSKGGAAYLKSCASRLFDDRAAAYLTARGFEPETAAIYGIGFDPEWRHPKSPSSVPTTPRLIIPCGDGAYIARDIRDEIPDVEKEYSKQFVKVSETAKIRPFGADEFLDLEASPDSPLFIVEGWADALSVTSAGAMAVALNSVAFVSSFVRDNAAFFRAKGFMLVLSLDNDEKGREAQAKLSALLKAERVAFIERDIVGGFKDANEALVKDGEGFRARVAAINAECVKQMASRQNKGVVMNNQNDEQKRRAEAEWAYQTLYPEVEAMRRKVEDGELMDDSPDAGLQDELDMRMSRNESLCACKEWLDDFLKDMKRPKPLFPSGFPKLDKAISGWSGGGLPVGLYVVGAISSLGKTTFLLQIADQMAEAGRDVLIFSLEMSRFELMGKSISRHSFLSLDEGERFSILDALREGKELPEVANQAFSMNAFRDFARLQEKGYVSTDAEGSMVAAAANYCNGAGQRVVIVEGMDNGVSMADIREAVKQYRDAHEGRVPVVIIDYLQMLKPPMDEGGRVLTDKMATDANILACKVLSRNYDTPVFVISSFSRGAYYANKGLAAFKESGAIEYTADVVLTLQYTAIDEAVKNKGEKEKEGVAVEEERKIKSKPVREVEVKILKNRSGAMADAPKYTFVPRFNTFLEV